MQSAKIVSHMLLDTTTILPWTSTWLRCLTLFYSTNRGRYGQIVKTRLWKKRTHNKNMYAYVNARQKYYMFECRFDCVYMKTLSSVYIENDRTLTETEYVQKWRANLQFPLAMSISIIHVWNCTIWRYIKLSTTPDVSMHAGRYTNYYSKMQWRMKEDVRQAKKILRNQNIPLKDLFATTQDLFATGMKTTSRASSRLFEIINLVSAKTTTFSITF